MIRRAFGGKARSPPRNDEADAAVPQRASRRPCLRCLGDAHSVLTRIAAPPATRHDRALTPTPGGGQFGRRALCGKVAAMKPEPAIFEYESESAAADEAAIA